MTQPSAPMSRLLALALEAGEAIMAIYATDFAARLKSDLTPLTEADEAAERIILKGLTELDPKTPVVSEEAAAAGRVPDVTRRFYLVDPLDGTKEFIGRNGEFTVNIALIDLGEPVLGIVLAPALGRIFWGERGHGAAQAAIEPGQPLDTFTWASLGVRPPRGSALTVVASRSHRDAETDHFLKTVQVGKLVSAGSSLKFCLIAAGEADLYPRFGRTMEWDTAAGHAVLAAAGGKVLTTDGAPLRYGKRGRGFDNPGFIASAAC